MSRTLLNVRYGIIALHTLLALVALPLCFAVTGSWLMFILHACSVVALFIYVPFALYVSLKDSPSKFDHAGGEVAYVTIQLACWIAAAIAGVLLSVVSETRCYDGFSLYTLGNYESIWRRHSACWALNTTSAFAFVQVIITVVWLAIVAYKANHVAGVAPNAAFQIPTHRLLVGRVNGESYGMSGMRRSGDVERAPKVVEEED